MDRRPATEKGGQQVFLGRDPMVGIPREIVQSSHWPADVMVMCAVAVFVRESLNVFNRASSPKCGQQLEEGLLPLSTHSVINVIRIQGGVCIVGGEISAPHNRNVGKSDRKSVV